MNVQITNNYNKYRVYCRDKMLRFRRETALQGGLVLAKSGRPEVGLGDNIILQTLCYLQPL